ncbi:TrbC/VirB2 family protein [Parasutterella muris]|uniref:Conjugal transfer protein TrbC n=2 Tax=Parasutterella TaxID=577310 RepID=A0A6L6YJY3_9BURK|nr:TrbC/VirB2 family protein [Parasutterella muris]MVX57033.1 hypothetical protein [Parasutterella muris]
MLKTLKILSPVLFVSLMICEPALAAAGTQSVNTLFNTILSTLQGVSLAVVTVAIVWAGYKVLFMGVALQQVAGPFMGAVVIAAAPWLAQLLVG